MRKWMALVGLTVVQGCGGPTGPTPDFVGNYLLVVEASSVCQLPVSRYDWNLIATSGGSGGSGGSGSGGSFRMTLPGGDNTLNLSLSYSSSGGGRGRGKRQSKNTTLSVTIDGQAVPFGSQLLVTMGGTARGTASVAPDGRGQVLDGTINGVIRLAQLVQPSPAPSPNPRPTPPPRPQPLGDCTAADHRWVLTPR